jgi:hypothetical protein
MGKQPLSQAVIDLGLGLTEEDFFAAQVKILFASADFEGLARHLQRLLNLQVQIQRLLNLQVQSDTPTKRRAARERATKIIFEVSGSAWAKRIVRGLLTRLPRGEDKQPARGAPPADRMADTQLMTTWEIWRKQNPNSAVRQFIEWHLYTFKKLQRPRQPARLEAEMTSAKARFERTRKRYNLRR